MISTSLSVVLRQMAVCHNHALNKNVSKIPMKILIVGLLCRLPSQIGSMIVSITSEVNDVLF